MRMMNLKIVYKVLEHKGVSWREEKRKCGVLKQKKLFWFNICK